MNKPPRIKHLDEVVIEEIHLKKYSFPIQKKVDELHSCRIRIGDYVGPDYVGILGGLLLSNGKVAYIGVKKGKYFVNFDGEEGRGYGVIDEHKCLKEIDGNVAYFAGNYAFESFLVVGNREIRDYKEIEKLRKRMK